MAKTKKKVVKAVKKPERKTTKKVVGFVEKQKRKPRKPKAEVVDTQPDPILDWAIVSIFVDKMMVFGLANDQRIYRWNPRAALWVLHKDGVTA